MASMGAMYAKALREDLGIQKGWMVNWPPTFSAKLGDVGHIEYDEGTGIQSFSGGNTLADFGIITGAPQSGPKGGKRSFSSGASTKVEFGVDAKLPDWNWIGNAKAGLHASFGREGGMEAEVTNPQQQRLPDLEGLKMALLSAATTGRLHAGQAIIVELEQADDGVIVASESEAGELKATTSADIGKGGVSLASFAADLDVKSKSGKALSQTLPKRFTTGFRVLVVGTKGLWWWKKITIRGLTAMSLEDAQDAAEAFLADDDYFAKYDEVATGGVVSPAT